MILHGYKYEKTYASSGYVIPFAGKHPHENAIHMKVKNFNFTIIAQYLTVLHRQFNSYVHEATKVTRIKARLTDKKTNEKTTFNLYRNTWSKSINGLNLTKQEWRFCMNSSCLSKFLCSKMLKLKVVYGKRCYPNATPQIMFSLSDV